MKTLLRTIGTLVMTVAIAGGLSVAAPAHAAPTADFKRAATAFNAGNPYVAIGHLNTALRTNPRDTNALALRAIYADYGYDLITKNDSLARLGAIDAGKRGRVDTLLNAILSQSLTPPNPLPAIIGPRTAVLILGYGLLPDGAMRPELIGRLTTGLGQAFMAPGSPVIVTGGNPKRGITEAAAMRAWLIRHGLPASRVHAEHRATSTAGNAVQSAALMRRIGAGSAVIVTDPNHIRRGVVDFITAGVPVVGAMATLNGYVQNVWPVLDKREQWAMYRDGISVLGLPG
ncbi:YdcF family protein [Gordonia sp. OPL2]|uniref:YdcF family protein n=1 Tax=Gordonia sp. OPL2 TaxID=2486274 RepID=UPI0021CC5809|nr:YdcF family protein [Gordonia sp. OPL2]